MPSGGERDYAENTLDWRNLGRSCDGHVLAGFTLVLGNTMGRQYQTFWLLTKRKPALVIRALQLVLQESIGDTAVMSDGNIGGGTRSLSNSRATSYLFPVTAIKISPR